MFANIAWPFKHLATHMCYADIWKDTHSTMICYFRGMQSVSFPWNELSLAINLGPPHHLYASFAIFIWPLLNAFYRLPPTKPPIINRNGHIVATNHLPPVQPQTQPPTKMDTQHPRMLSVVYPCVFIWCCMLCAPWVLFNPYQGWKMENTKSPSQPALAPTQHVARGTQQTHIIADDP